METVEYTRNALDAAGRTLGDEGPIYMVRYRAGADWKREQRRSFALRAGLDLRAEHAERAPQVWRRRHAWRTAACRKDERGFASIPGSSSL